MIFKSIARRKQPESAQSTGTSTGSGAGISQGRDKGGKDRPELRGSDHEDNSNPSRRNSDLPCSKRESEHRTKNYFCQANKTCLFQLSYHDNIHIQRSM